MGTAPDQPMFKAVCYRCSYESKGLGWTLAGSSEAGSEPRCPSCEFPMILESEATPPKGRRLEEIFARPSVGSGAPPLPGVRGPTTVSGLVEVDQERGESERPEAAGDWQIGSVAAMPGEMWWVRAKVALVCTAAIAFGVLAGVLRSGL